MTLRPIAMVAALALVMVLTACGEDEEPTAQEPEPQASETASSPTGVATPTTRPARRPDGTVITTGDSEFGPMLFDANDQAIYMWESEPTSKPACYDDCEVAWPPVLTKGKPVAKGAVDTALLGTTKRRDGSVQVTYNDHPLYFYAHEGPGEVECHNVSTHGGLWWVVTPEGDRAP